jgi:hypothetical protein
MTMGKGKILFQIIFYLFASQFAYSQKKSVFSGEFLNERNELGTANYTFYLDQNKKEVIDGRFSFLSNYQNPDNCNQYIEIKANGNYKNGFKNALWQYHNKTLEIADFMISGISAKSTLNGSILTVNANYLDGLAHGKWNMQEEEILKSKTSKITKKASANYLNGKISGDFFYINDVSNNEFFEIKGNFNKDGDFDKDWQLVFFKGNDKIIEKRTYRNGFLISLQKINMKSDSLLYDIKYTDVEKKLNMLAQYPDSSLGYTIGDEKFGILFNDGYHSDSEMELAQNLGNSFISKALKTFCDKEGEVFSFKGIKNFATGSTRRFIYEYTKEEEDNLKNSLEYLNQSKSLIKELLENKSFQVNKQKTDSLAYTFAAIKHFENKIAEIEDFARLLNSEDFKYQSRENYFNSTKTNIFDSDTIFYDYDGKDYFNVFTIQNTTKTNSVVDLLFNYTSKILESIKSYQSYLLPYFLQFQKDSEMLIYEEKILESSNALALKYVENDATPSKYQKIIYEKFANSVRNHLMQEYSNEDNHDKKVIKAEEILSLNKTLDEIFNSLDEIEKIPKKLDEQFTFFAYNPYNGQYDIKTRIKKRLYSKIQEELLPYQFEKLKNETDFNELPILIAEINLTMKQMIFISKQTEKESSKLEKRVRKEKDLDKVFKILKEYN